MERIIEVEVPVTRHAPSELRRQLEPLRHELEQQVYDTVALIVSEAASHATKRPTDIAQDERVRLVLSVEPERVRGEVRDGRLGFGVTIDDFRHDGVGDSLYVIDHVSSAWGLEFTEGAMLWFEVGRPAGHSG
jgi:hypothetical protein